MACLGKHSIYPYILLVCTEIRGLGMWGAGEAIRALFKMSGAATSFGCKSPV